MGHANVLLQGSLEQFELQLVPGQIVAADLQLCPFEWLFGWDRQGEDWIQLRWVALVRECKFVGRLVLGLPYLQLCLHPHTCEAPECARTPQAPEVQADHN